MGYNMQVAVKIFFFAFWVSSITLAENEECLKGNINYENTQISNLNERYTHGQTVKLNCASGYVGSLRLECENGIWTKIAGRECKKKPCGHPGDTPNGDFKLTKDSEFVFGATVEYTCRPGYIMASRVKHRNCRIDGWDNAVPVCEVVKCPIISNLGDVIATGNTEEASYGDVIHFECASPDKMLEGPEDIHCKSDGQWSDKIPKCIEIKCLPPEIPHGFTNLDKEYKENNILQYSCEKGYNPRPGNPRCTKYGWSIKPECEVITCLLGSPTTGVVSTKPIGKNIFLAGEYVEIICSKKYWIFGTKQVSRNIKCKDDGKWELRPVCEEITCEYPEGEHLLNNPNYKRIYKLGENTWYRCEYGYQRTAASITCTENGWEPEPRCIEITCQKPEIAHGEVLGIQKNTYNKNVKIALKCNQGYEPGIFFVTCKQNGEWDNMRQCTLGINLRCRYPEREINDAIRNDTNLKAYYEEGGGVQYKCKEGFYFQHGSKAVCSAGKWKYPQCIKYTTCEYPRGEHLLNNPPNFKRIYKLGENTWYRCEYGYQRTAASITCTENSWEPEPQCIEITCQKPEIAHGEVLGIQKNTYNKNVKIALKCNQGYEPGIFFVTCNQNGEWDNMRQCTLITCLLGSPTTGVVSTKPIGKNIFLAGEYVEIICSKKYWIFGTKQVSRNIKCKEDGKWELRPVCEEITCEYPRGEHLLNNPPYNKHIYKLGENTRYRCEYGYKHRAASITCTENSWEPEPQCIEITCQKPEIAHGEVLRIQKYTYNKNVKIALKCNQGYEPGIFFVTCNQNGEWENMRQCTLVKCPIISNLGDVITTDNTEEARYGDFIHFKCASPNKMLEGPEEIHCKDDGQWSDKIPKCKEKTTCAKTSVQNGFTYKLPGGFSYSCHANYKAFDEKWWGVVICTEGPQSYAPLCIPNDQCGQIPNVHAKKIQEKKGYKNEETVEFECESKPCCFKCISGTWQDCQCIPPSVENAVITSHSQHQVEYICRNNYTITGKRLISCNSSQWKELPSCNLGINLKCRDPEREINDAIRNDPNLKAYYEEGGSVQYRCKEGFYFQHGSKAVCSAGKWNYPQCIKLGINLRCRDPEREINDAIRNDTNLKAYYEEGGGVQYKCKEGLYFQNGSKAMCSAGKWNYPQCIKSLNIYLEEKNETARNEESFLHENVTAGQTRLQSKVAEKPTCRKPKRIKNGTLMSDQKQFYEEGETVEYQCTKDFQFKNGSIAICSGGVWVYPKCIQK
ncbi:complement factor H isoform X3 [Ictalurus punctatus]|uniref:Complement factor H isoform X3 n=1 Tax=Ictalurus punctatus TaxID=7998 RepID=A0A9F7REI4_ICTPU|nr:complement factor H isoform X3 [Ictalurus punctatus]